MEWDRLIHLPAYFFTSIGGTKDRRKIRRVRAPARSSTLKHDTVAMYLILVYRGGFNALALIHRVFPLSPACLRILFTMPGGRSCPGCPGIVTEPRQDTL